MAARARRTPTNSRCELIFRWGRVGVSRFLIDAADDRPRLSYPRVLRIFGADTFAFLLVHRGLPNYF